MATSKSQAEADAQQEQKEQALSGATGSGTTTTTTGTTGSGFQFPPEVLAQLAKIAELNQLLRDPAASLILRSLVGGAQIAGPPNPNLNVFFAKLQQRSLPRGSFRFSSSSSI